MPLTLDETPVGLVNRVFGKVKRGFRALLCSGLRRDFSNLPAAPPVDRGAFTFRIHMLVGRRDLDMAICACKSLIMVSDGALPFLFHDDGTLKEAHVKRLIEHFPGCRVVSRAESDRVAEERLKDYPVLLSFRKAAVMMLKLVDVRLFAETGKAIVMDSDILFFKHPVELFHFATTADSPNVFNRDIDSAYMLESAVLESIAGKPLLPQLNAGLSVIQISTIDFQAMENWLKKIKPMGGIMHRVEQSLIAMLSAVSNLGARHLPKDYDVAYFKEVDASVCKHYVGRIRFGFELEGLAFLKKQGFKSKWRLRSRFKETKIV